MLNPGFTVFRCLQSVKQRGIIRVVYKRGVNRDTGNLTGTADNMQIPRVDRHQGMLLKKTPFSSFETFHTVFNKRLTGLLSDYDELGIYILVMAHAGFDSTLRKSLVGPLKKRFNRMAGELRKGRKRGLYLDDAGDDLQVFQSMMDIEFDGLRPAQFRSIGPWELQCGWRVKWQIKSESRSILICLISVRRFCARRYSGRAGSLAAKRLYSSINSPSLPCTVFWCLSCAAGTRSF